MLYAITDDTLMPGPLLISQSEAALKGGCQWLQYRNKSTNREQRLADAQQLYQLCLDYRAKLIINDDAALAQQVNAHGVHLGQDDGSIRQARILLGPEAIIGVTCHDQIVLAQQAIAEGASYVAFGRFFPSQTKPNAKAAPLTLLKEALALGVPITAIGGITLANAAQVIAGGASAIAVCHSLFACNNVEARARDFCRVISA